MRKSVVISFIFVVFIGLCLSHTLMASHLLGGQISADVVSCNGYTYNIRITLLEDLSSTVTFGNGSITFGDGTVIDLNTGNYQTKVVSIDTIRSVSLATFEIQHTFPSPGKYLIYFQEFNRSADIVNMQNSVGTPFYLETVLTIDPATGCNNAAALPLDAFSLFAQADTIFTQDLPARDADGDSLSYLLVTPKRATDKEVNAYLLPSEYEATYYKGITASDGTSSPVFAVTNYQLDWDAPRVNGSYVYTLRIDEWRNVAGETINIGYSLVDIMLTVENGRYPAPNLQREPIPPLTLFPNPSDGDVTLLIRQDQWIGGSLIVYNVLGQQMAQGSIAEMSIPMDFSQQSAGVYLIVLQKGTEKETLRLIKR